MEHLQEFLDKSMTIDGAKGVALVDLESGMCLGTKGGGSLDMELAGASAAKIVQTKMAIIEQLELNETSEETLLTMETQYHLIRLLQGSQTIFSYLILDKDQCTLPLARTHLKSLGRDLSLDSLQPPDHTPEQM